MLGHRQSLIKTLNVYTNIKSVYILRRSIVVSLGNMKLLSRFWRLGGGQLLSPVLSSHSSFSGNKTLNYLGGSTLTLASCELWWNGYISPPAPEVGTLPPLTINAGSESWSRTYKGKMRWLWTWIILYVMKPTAEPRASGNGLDTWSPGSNHKWHLQLLEFSVIDLYIHFSQVSLNWGLREKKLGEQSSYSPGRA